MTLAKWVYDFVILGNQPFFEGGDCRHLFFDGFEGDTEVESPPRKSEMFGDVRVPKPGLLQQLFCISPFQY